MEVRRTHIAEHMLQAFGLPALAVCAIFAGVFGVFLAQVEEEFVVCDECRLGVFDLGISVFRSNTYRGGFGGQGKGALDEEL